MCSVLFHSEFLIPVGHLSYHLDELYVCSCTDVFTIIIFLFLVLLFVVYFLFHVEALLLLFKVWRFLCYLLVSPFPVLLWRFCPSSCLVLMRVSHHSDHLHVLPQCPVPTVSNYLHPPWSPHFLRFCSASRFLSFVSEVFLVPASSMS